MINWLKWIWYKHILCYPSLYVGNGFWFDVGDKVTISGFYSTSSTNADPTVYEIKCKYKGNAVVWYE